MQKITPFMWFDKNAGEAIDFYVSIFANAPNAIEEQSKIVSIKRYPEGPLDGPMKGMEGKILTAVFELDGQRFMALDGGPYFKPTGAVSFYIEAETQDEVDYYWGKLIEGGDEKAQQCGWLMDKYGFSWQVVPTVLPMLLNNENREKADRAMQAMLAMKKIDIIELQRAFDGREENGSMVN